MSLLLRPLYVADQPGVEGEKTDKVWAFVNVVQKLAKGLLGECDLAECLMKPSKDHKVSLEPGELEDLWGPKTSEPVDLNTL